MKLFDLFVCFTISLMVASGVGCEHPIYALLENAKKSCKALKDFGVEPAIALGMTPALLRSVCGEQLILEHLAAPTCSDYFATAFYEYCFEYELKEFCEKVLQNAEKIRRFQTKASEKNSTMVKVAFYDLSCGKAKPFSSLLNGNGVIYHTEIEIGGCRMYFSNEGLHYYCGKQSSTSACFAYEEPYGYTNLDRKKVFQVLGQSDFKSYLDGNNYDLWDNNCNSFVDHLVGFLTGRTLPDKVKFLPRNVEKSELGQAFKVIYKTHKGFKILTRALTGI